MNLQQITIMKVLCSENAGFTISDLTVATGLESGEVLASIRELKSQQKVVRVGDAYKATISAEDIPASQEQQKTSEGDSDVSERVCGFLEANPKGHLPKAIREALNIDKHVLATVLKRLKTEGTISSNPSGFYFFGRPPVKDVLVAKPRKNELDSELDGLRLLNLSFPQHTKKMLNKFKGLVPSNGPSHKLLEELIQQIP